MWQQRFDTPDRREFLKEYPQWMDIAKRELGTAEIPGAAKHNPRIEAYISTCGYSYGDETPWCSAFVNWVFRRVGYSRTSNLSARSWQRWGRESAPRYGAIAVLKRTEDPTKGHVAFLDHEAGEWLFLLGGNQHQQVKVSRFARDRLLGYRWPIEKDFDRPGRDHGYCPRRLCG